MKTNFLKMVAMATFTVLVMTGCKSSNQASNGYVSNQKTPSTVEQRQAANRGLKVQKEECEELALEMDVKNLRESGNGVSDKESFAVNLALLDARAKLAQQLEVLVSGLIRNFNQQHAADKDFTSVEKASQLQQGYFEQFLTNTRPICKNTYVKEDGKYNVYVCVEMGEQQQRAMYKKLSDDKKVSVDFAEHQFMQELGKAKGDYLQKQQQ
ncbi:MAG: hypothetical protein LBM08_15070 [Dysgonamonadaceae bacterium]|jgi:hypothetical protein|nr:hypothetical protein [Dysgonamonadaceae bacterium]